jgi:hypothetical protein
LAVSWEEGEAGLAGEVEEAVAGLWDLLVDALEEAGDGELRRGLEDAILLLEDLRKLLLRYAERAERGALELPLLDKAERAAKQLLSDLEDLEWRSGGRLSDALSEACERAESLVDLVDMLREWAEDAMADAAPADDDWDDFDDYLDDEEIDDLEEDLV